jgi:hypothetical protein
MLLVMPVSAWHFAALNNLVDSARPGSNLSRAFAVVHSHGVETQQGVVVMCNVLALRAFAGLPTAAAETPT